MQTQSAEFSAEPAARHILRFSDWQTFIEIRYARSAQSRYPPRKILLLLVYLRAYLVNNFCFESTKFLCTCAAQVEGDLQARGAASA